MDGSVVSWPRDLALNVRVAHGDRSSCIYRICVLVLTLCDVVRLAAAFDHQTVDGSVRTIDLHV